MTELDPCLPSTLTRRRLVLAGGTAAIGLYVLGAVPALAAATAPAYLRRASYADVVGATFGAVSPAGAPVALRLTSVADLARAQQTRSLAGRDDAFALTFSGPSGPVVDSGIQRLRHPSLGWISLFITPVGAAVGSQLYEVVVDRAAP
jgi:hypothetical protein